MIPEEKTQEIIKEIQCLSGEQLDPMENRCLPCSHYNLVWDPENKVCKTMLKEDISKEQEKELLLSGLVLNKLDLVSDDKNNIIGYLDK